MEYIIPVLVTCHYGSCLLGWLWQLFVKVTVGDAVSRNSCGRYAPSQNTTQISPISSPEACVFIRMYQVDIISNCCSIFVGIQQVDIVSNFHVGELVTSLQKATLIPGGSEALVYTTLSGGIGMLVPFTSHEVQARDLQALSAGEQTASKSLSSQWISGLQL